MMKRIFSILGAILIMTYFATAIARVTAIEQTSAEKPASTTITEDIYKIFQKSCMDCHAKGGRKMAMSKVNFSEWDNYSTEKKAVKAADIVKMLQKEKMPPKLYRQSHPENIPTPAQIESIAKWADSLPKK